MSSEGTPPRIQERVEIVERAPWLEPLSTHFGIPSDAFDGLLLFRANTRSLYLVCEDHTPPSSPEPQSYGIPFLHTQMAHPIFFTGSAMTFGARATQNFVETTELQADRYLSRRSFVLHSDQLGVLTGNGHVLVRHRGFCLGLGIARDIGGDEPHVESHFPKSLSISEEHTAFPGSTHQETP